VVNDQDEALYKSLRNIGGVDVIAAHQLNAYAVLRSDELVFTDASLQRATEVFGG
jgi:ribosomal protein L4